MNRYQYFKAGSLEEAFSLMDGHPGAILVAGGTDLMVQIKNRDIEPKALISLRSVAELGGITFGGTTRIGSNATARDLVENKEIAQKFPLLSQAAKRLGSPQIRSVATVGGNICNASPCADMALALLALEARVEIASAKERREVPLADFFKGPGMTCLESGEIVTGVQLDELGPKAQSIFMEKGRVMMDIATASLAVVAEMEGGVCKKARIAAGSVGPTPLRLKGVEKIVQGKKLSSDVISDARKAAEQEVSPITDIRSTAEYRRQMIGVFTQRSLEELVRRDNL